MSARCTIALATLLCLAGGLAAAAGLQLPGRVLRVIDGDSLVLDVRGGLYGIELADIDAPEPNQPWGETAAERLRTQLTGMFVVVSDATPGPTMRGRVLFKGRDVALDLLHDGLAWSTIPPDPQRPNAHPYNEAQDHARAARRGLWSDAEPIPPWTWRTGAGAGP